MTVYRIKHKPTGMYYAPTRRTTRNGAYLKTNPNNAKPSVTKEGWEHYDCNAGWTKFDPKEWEVEKC